MRQLVAYKRLKTMANSEIRHPKKWSRSLKRGIRLREVHTVVI